jgi:K+-sensing histidine kinase KdpD
MRLEKFSLQALLITQLRTGNFLGEPKTIRIETVFQESINEFDDQLKSKKIRLQSKIGPATYHTDGILFKYLIDNLIQIGINNCNTGGLLEISGWLISGNRYVLTLRHSGQAFPDSVLLNPQALFSEENFTDRCPHLLLYTVRLILNHLHGELVLRNNQGGLGARIEITLHPDASF